MGCDRTADGRDLVHCAEHGASEACLLCRHLRTGRGLRFYAIQADPWAWCEECDAVLEQEQGWSDRLNQFAGWQVYCRGCYRRALRRHCLREWVALTEESP